MQYDLIFVLNKGFTVQNRILTNRSIAVWPAKMLERTDLVPPSLVLKRNIGYAEAQRMKERCEKAWGKMGYGLNYEQLP